ncbi:hypothetical protein J8I29_25795 [Labrys sp. LIt4]|uniref:hypothetical protein n=1 Tax=Labrys sp. LIt4 TaxID=2821355 RepID=UPI001ADFB5F4|nr:hypothetical protein [Labrys sp. LIt4]MBP0582765.1 hypothetical protein [Labrys sp. LIt4]
MLPPLSQSVGSQRFGSCVLFRVVDFLEPLAELFSRLDQNFQAGFLCKANESPTVSNGAVAMFARLIWSAAIIVFAIFCGIVWWVNTTNPAKQGAQPPAPAVSDRE